MHDDLKIAIVAITDVAGNLLMIRRTHNPKDENSMKWEFPAGHIDPGEIPAVAAVREVREETGLDVFLLPHGIIIPTKRGKAAYYLGFVQDSEAKPRVELAPKEHDNYIWVKAKNFDRMVSTHRTHKRMKENLIDLLTHISEKLKVQKKTAQRVISSWNYWYLARRYAEARREALTSNPLSPKEEKDVKKSRKVKAQESLTSEYARDLPGPGEELKEAILVGDEVEIFLKKHMTNDGKTPEPSISGVVEKRDRNTIWIRSPEDDDKQVRSVNWDDRGNWAFVRVYRGPDQAIYYANGNPYDKDSGEVSKARGLGLILESDPPTRYESVWSLMRGETPDLDRSMGQAPQSIDVVAPSRKPKPGTPEILTQVKDVIKSHGLEPEIVDHLGKGRVLILTQDSDMKKEIIKVLESHGKKVESSRRGFLIVRQGASLSTMGTTTVPIATDDDLMLLTRHKRERDLQEQKKKKRQSAVPVTPQQMMQQMPQGVQQIPQGVPLTPQQMMQQGQQNQQKIINPGATFVIPNSKDQANAIKSQYGNMPTKALPGNATQLKMNAQQAKKYTGDISKNPAMQNPKASRQEILRVARSLAQSLRDQEYDNSNHYISQLREMGVKEASISRSAIASKRAWGHLHRYLDSIGEIENSRIARTASRLAPDF